MDPNDTKVDRQLVTFTLGRPVAHPRCRFVDGWNAARDAGAPPDAKATIEYAEAPTVDGCGLRWRFTAEGFGADVSGDDCSLIGIRPRIIR